MTKAELLEQMKYVPDDAEVFIGIEEEVGKDWEGTPLLKWSQWRIDEVEAGIRDGVYIWGVERRAFPKRG